MRRLGLLLISAIAVAACGSNSIGGATAAPGTPAPAVVEPLPTDDLGGVEAETPVAVSLPDEYNVPSKRTWAKIVKAPDKYIGKGLKLYACIYQFDAATGEEGFLGNASYKRQEYWNLNGESAAFVGDADALADFVEGDIIRTNVVILGSYSYDTQAGGNTTVPSFQVVKASRQKGSCD